MKLNYLLTVVASISIIGCVDQTSDFSGGVSPLDSPGLEHRHTTIVSNGGDFHYEKGDGVETSEERVAFYSTYPVVGLSPKRALAAGEELTVISAKRKEFIMVRLHDGAVGYVGRDVVMPQRLLSADSPPAIPEEDSVVIYESNT